MYVCAVLRVRLTYGNFDIQLLKYKFMLDSKMTTLLGINDDVVHPCHFMNRVTHGICPQSTLQTMLYLSLSAGSNVNHRSFRDPPPPPHVGHQCLTLPIKKLQ